MAVDPFTAFGLAAGIAQFIDFSTSLVSGTIEIYQSLDGISRDHAALAERSRVISQLTTSITGKEREVDLDLTSTTAEKNGLKASGTQVAAKGQEGERLPKLATFSSKNEVPNASEPHGFGNKLSLVDTRKKVNGMAASIESSLHSWESIKMTIEEQALAPVARSCQKTAEEVSEALEKLTVPGCRKSKFRSFRQALKSVWGKKKLEELEKRLDRHRGDLGLCLTAVIR